MQRKMVRGCLPVVLILLTFAMGCGDEQFSDAQITSLTLSRTTFTTSETGMTDEFITATVTFEGFFDEVDPERSEIFLQDFDRAAVPQSATVSGNTLTLTDIATSWLSVSPGTHSIGATVATPTESVTQLNLATVTITE